MKRYQHIIPVIAISMMLLSCGGGGESSSSPSATTDNNSNPPPVNNVTSPAWQRYIGAHYTLSPGNLPYRDWAKGGLRDPGGNRTNYQITSDGAGGYIDSNLANFDTLALPVIEELLADGRYAVVTVGGGGSGDATLFFDSIATSSGRDAYRKALYDRIDRIRALTHGAGWEQKIYFQFGNEIQNVNAYYGNVCNWATANANSNCDLATQFVPAYVERYLAPGVEALEAKSQELFGRNDAIRMMLGSIVNLTKREEFLATLLNYQVQGEFAPSLRGKHVYDLVDTISLHYTAGESGWRVPLDNFYQTYLPGGTPIGRVRRTWATEEIGGNAAEQGYGMAAMLHGIARYLSWWQEHQMGPDDGHMFAWAADKSSPPDGSCVGCTSADAELPLLTNFTGLRAMLSRSVNQSTLTAANNIEMHEFDVEGVFKRVIVIMSTDTNSTSMNSLLLNLDGWNGRTTTVTAYRYATQGAEPLTVVPSNTTVSGNQINLTLSATLQHHDALLILVDAETR